MIQNKCEVQSPDFCAVVRNINRILSSFATVLLMVKHLFDSAPTFGGGVPPPPPKISETTRPMTMKFLPDIKLGEEAHNLTGL